jgi:endonuclease YncB( thermonuclease family)
VDADTVKFGPQLVRLIGIDAPEKTQTCDDGQWRPGPLAKKALENSIAGRPVTCKQVDYDTRSFGGASSSSATLTDPGRTTATRPG